MAADLPECPDRRFVGDSQFFCERLFQWFLRSGLECNRCQAGQPVTTDDYRDALHRKPRKDRT